MSYRIRTRGDVSNLVDHKKSVLANGTVSADYDIQNRALLKIGEFQKTTDVVTPNYRARIERGDIVNNPFSSWTEAYSPSFSGYKLTRAGATGTQVKTEEEKYLYGDLSFSEWGIKYVDLSEFFKEICTEVAAKVATTNVDGTTEAAEGRDMRKLFDRRILDLKGQFEREMRYAEKKGKRYHPGSPLDVLAGNWLRIRYGIAPLLYLLEDTIVKGSKIQSRRETARASTVTGNSEQLTYPIVGGLAAWDCQVTRTWEASLRAGILYTYDTFRNKYGLALDQLPLAMWNLVPLSYVYDWFANMSEFIGAVVPKAGVRSLASWHGYEQRHTSVASVSNFRSINAQYTVSIPLSGQMDASWVGRRRAPGIVAPSLTLKESGLNDFFESPKHMVDALALTIQRLNRVLSMR